MPAVKPSVVEMDEIASLEWDRLKHAMPPGLYTAMDVALMTQYALAWSMLVKAQSEIDSGGIITFTEKGYGVSPAVKVWKAASETLLKCADRLGLHPGARVRLQVPKRGSSPEPGAGSKFAGFLGQTKQ
jgi:P27 family predicted phage terminase small subunit